MAASITASIRRGAHVEHTDLRAISFHHVRLLGLELVDVEISGEIEDVTINGVDIGPLIEAELNRRMPNRAKMHPTTVEGFQEAWAILERLWAGTEDRARTLPARVAARGGPRGVVLHRDAPSPRLRERRLGRPDGPRRPGALAPARPSVGRSARLGGHPLGPRGASFAGRGPRRTPQAPGHGPRGDRRADPRAARRDGHLYRAGVAAAQRLPSRRSACSSWSTRNGTTGSTPSATWMCS